VTRSNDTTSFTFFINHADAPAPLSIDGTDVVTGEELTAESTVPAGGVRVVATALTGTASDEREPELAGVAE
jgi:beta-galactosidase